MSNLSFSVPKYSKLKTFLFFFPVSFYQLNPMVPLIEAYRAILLKGTQPDWQVLLIVSLAVAVILPIGLAIFRRQSNTFVEEL